ncbi:uncharacterized protein LOC142775311 [Rhipicephalus microplus]|uniref:uncharacterized protein LOC142775311 n=1 Tax=Rhipicephalus microplus TaxID=6941 RepID=UPI003F6B1A88
MVVGMVSLGGSLAVVLMYIAFVSLDTGDYQTDSFHRSNESLSARSLVWPRHRCPDPKFYKCSPQLGSWPQPGDESWFFLVTRFGPGCFKWDAEAQCLWDSPAHFKELQHCQKHCHRGEALSASQCPIVYGDEVLSLEHRPALRDTCDVAGW